MPPKTPSLFSRIIVSLFIALSWAHTTSKAVAEPPRTAPIIDGTPVSADEYPYVARIEYEGDILCTGTLVGQRHVLTAAHCFYDEDGRRSVGNGDLIVRFGSSQTIRSSQVYINSTYRARENACNEGEIDAAVVVLARDVTGVSPIPMMSSAVASGSTVFLAGFGTQGSGDTGEDGTTPDVGTVKVGNASVDGFGDDPPSNNSDSIYFYWNFISGESNTASGDSGGPAFQDVDGQRHLAGITCGGYGNSEYGTYSLDTRVDKIKSWVDSHIGSQPTSRTVNIKGVELNYDNSKNDYLYIKGQIEVGSAFKPRGKTFTVKIGNYTKSFKLNADAEAGNSKSYFGLTGSYRGSAFKSSTVKYEVEFIRLPQLFQEFSGLGFPVSADATANQEAVLPITISVDGVEGTASTIVSYRTRGKVWKVKPGQ